MAGCYVYTPRDLSPKLPREVAYQWCWDFQATTLRLLGGDMSSPKLTAIVPSLIAGATNAITHFSEAEGFAVINSRG